MATGAAANTILVLPAETAASCHLAPRCSGSCPVAVAFAALFPSLSLSLPVSVCCT